MTTDHSHQGLRHRERIIRATVGLLTRRGLLAVTPDAISAAADLDRADFDETFGSVPDVYVAILASLLDDHVANTGGTVQGDRTLVESLQQAMRSVWDLVEARIDVHHAIYVMTVTQAGNPELVQQMGFSIHDTHLRVAEAWLLEIESIHSVRWEIPIDQLGLLLQATLDGLVLDFLSRRDSADIHQALDIFAGQLTLHAGSASTNSSS